MRSASVDKVAELAQLNAQLIQGEGHDKPMSVAELEQPMAEWLPEAGAGTAMDASRWAS